MSKIITENVSFEYTKDTMVLNNINLEIDNRTTAIIGQNGAGKTTFVKILKGLLRPSKGTIIVDDEDISTLTVAQIAKKIGMVFQNPNDQIFKNKVLDEVMFGPKMIGMSEDKAKENSLRALEMVGLIDKCEANPYDLGLSERKMVAIASIIAMDTQVIIFDEPTIGQDFKGKERLKNIILSLKNEGKTVITIIHDMDFVAECFDRTIVLCKGRVLADDNTKMVFMKDEILKEARLEKPHIMQLTSELSISPCLTVEEFILLKNI